MKKLILTGMALMLIGCHSSSVDDNDATTGNGDSPNTLIGTWQSGCHEYLEVETASGNPVYAISNKTITATTYTDVTSTFSDADCVISDDAADESFTFSYETGAQISASDGLPATRITSTYNVPDRPDITPVTFEFAYRVSGDNLHFGEITAETSSEFDYRITYTRQASIVDADSDSTTGNAETGNPLGGT